MTTYHIRSIKHKETFVGEVDAAIARATELDKEMQPSFGTQVETEDGDIVWDSEDAMSDVLYEIAQAVEAADVCCPVQVVDMCMIAHRNGMSWRDELARAKAEDADERRAMGIE